MTLEITILIGAVLTNSVLLGLVLYRNPKSASHRLFSLLTFIINCYLIANYIAVTAQTEFAAIWSVRATMFFAAPLSVTFFLLMHTFPRATMLLPKRTQVIWVLLTLFTMALTLTPYVFKDAKLVEGGPPSPTPGIGMVVFAVVGVGTIPLGFYYLIRKRHRANGIQRIQMNFLLLGVSLMFTAIITFIFVGTVVLGTSTFAQYAPIFTLPFTGLSAYVMIRHRLLDIRGAIFRALSLTLLVGAVLAIYGLLLIFAVPLISQYTGISADILAGAAALISIPVAKIVQRGLTKLTDRFLFQNRADYRAALVELGKKLSRTINIDEVTSIIIDAVRNIVRTKKAAILLRNPESKVFEPRGQQGMEGFNAVIQPDNPLLEYLREDQNVTSKDELMLAKEQGKNEKQVKEIETIEQTMQWLDVAIIMPLFINRELTGLIILGDKLSGSPYLKDDIEFLTGFAAQAAVALENARLYQESLEFGEKLQEEVKRATTELETANIQLRNLDKAKSEFLSIASHQLYTPLTALRGYVSMMQEGDFGDIPEKQKEVLDILHKSADRLVELIKSLLDISRIERGRLELNLESVDLAEMANELVQDLLPNAMAKDLQLNFHPPTEPIPHAVVDRQRIRQVMLNFVDNAIKYTHAGRIDVRIGHEGDDVVFSVQDTGKGISQEDIARLFNKFTRVGGSSRFHTEGVGLGLYVAKQIVKEHRGTLEASSSGEGKGSTFMMRLPAEGTPGALSPGQHATVEIKAAEAERTQKAAA